MSKYIEVETFADLLEAPNGTVVYAACSIQLSNFGTGMTGDSLPPASKWLKANNEWVHAFGMTEYVLSSYVLSGFIPTKDKTQAYT